MSLTINTSGGGGGTIQSTDALVRLVADYGSSVSVTAGGTTKTLKSLPIIGESGKSCYYDIVKPGAFSATARSYAATLGSDSASESIVVNAAGEYTGSLLYWNGELYLNGNEYTDHTGGWTSNGVKIMKEIIDYPNVWPVSAKAPTLTNSGGYLTAVLSTSGTSNYSGSVMTANKVDLTSASRVTYVLNNNGTYHTRRVILYVTEDAPVDGAVYSASAETYTDDAGDQTVSVDVSSLTGSYYVGFTMWVGGDGGTSTVTISSIILS